MSSKRNKQHVTIVEDKKNEDKEPKRQKSDVKIFRNPFLNFLRDFRRMNSSLSVTEIASKGARRWNKMTPKEKMKYRRPSPYCYQMKRSNRSRSKRRNSSRSYRRPRVKSRSRTRSRSRSRSRSKSKSKSKLNKSDSKTKNDGETTKNQF